MNITYDFKSNTFFHIVSSGAAKSLTMGGSPSCQMAAVNMKGPVADVVKSQINENCVMIFSKTYCPYCKMAKKVRVMRGPYINFAI